MAGHKKEIYVHKKDSYRPVCVVLGVEEASKVAGVSREHVKRLLRTGKMTRKGYSFERKEDYERRREERV